MADTAGRDYDYLEEQAKRSSDEWQTRRFFFEEEERNAVRFNRAAFTPARGGQTHAYPFGAGAPAGQHEPADAGTYARNRRRAFSNSG